MITPEFGRKCRRWIAACLWTAATLVLIQPVLHAATLSNGSLTLDVRNDNGAIQSVSFGGADFFGNGIIVSDWALQNGADTSAFRRNTGDGATTGTPVTVASTPAAITVSGTYSIGGANVPFTRVYSLIPGQNAFRIRTTLTNAGAGPVTIRTAETFDPDQGAGFGLGFFTFLDVLNVPTSVGNTPVAQSFASNDLTVILGSVPGLNGVVAAGTPFAIDSGANLNSVYTAPADANGAFMDAGMHLVFERTLAPGASVSTTALMTFGTTHAAAQAAYTASVGNPPVANDDSYPAPVTPAPYAFNVLSNDSDPDVDTLTITGVTNGLYGTVTTNGTTVTYTPGPSYHGNDTFTYTIADSFGLTDTATVTIYQAADVTTLPATTIIPTAAILNASANPHDVSTSVVFQYSTDPGLTGAVTTGSTNIGSGSAPVPVSMPITGLMPNTRYYFRAVATSVAGTSNGAILDFLTPVIVWGGAGSNATTGVIDGTIIPTTTSTPVRYVNASNQGYDIVASTYHLGQDGLGSIFGTPGWFFEGVPSTSSGYAAVTFRFLDTTTNSPVGVTGIRLRLEDAEFTERFANFSYWDDQGNKFTLNFDSSIFTYSGPPIYSNGRTSVENGVPYEGGTQAGKWIDIDLSTRAISGFEIQARRQNNSAGSVIMSGWGGGALPMNLWRQEQFGADYTNESIVGDFADPNGDGIINLLSYSFGIDPVGPPSGGLPVVALVGGYLQVTFNHPFSVTDITYQVEVSSDLITWLPGSKYSPVGDIPSNANTTQLSRTPAGLHEVIVVRDNVLFGVGPRYIRVRVTR